MSKDIQLSLQTFERRSKTYNICENKYCNEDMVKCATIIHISVCSKELLKLINVNPKESPGEGAPLLDPNSAPDKVKETMCCPKLAHNKIIKPHDSNNEALKDANVTSLLKQQLPGN